MSKYINIEEEEKEAGNPHYQTEEPQLLFQLDEEETAPPNLPNGEEQSQQAAMDDDIAKPFNAKEEYDILMQNIRTPRSYQANVAQANKDKKFRETISALSLLLNTAKGALGGNIRLESYSGITAAANEAKAYQAMEDKDADRYDDAKNKLWMDLYNLQLKDKATQRSYQKELEKIFAKEGADARNIQRRHEATKTEIGLRGDVTMDVEGNKQKNREASQRQKFGHQMSLEAFKQQGRERLAAIRDELKKAGQLDKPFIDVKSPYGKGSVGLTKGEALEFFNWLLDNGDVTQDDYTLMFESLTGTAANNMVQSKVVDYVNKYPQPMKQILSNRGKGVEYTPSITSKSSPLQSRSTNPTESSKNPLRPRK